MATSSIAKLCQGFSKLNKQERLARLLQMGLLQAEDVAHLSADRNLSTDLAEKLVENVIGYFHMPLGVATNFCIDGRDYMIPMAVEETSIIAAASKTAKWIREQGEITTAVKGDHSIGQIQIALVRNFDHLVAVMTENKQRLIALANEHVAHGLVARGGGVVDIAIRKIARGDGHDMAVLHVLVNTCDAMGANIVNQVCEYLKPLIEELTHENITMCILSNLNDTRLATAQIIIRNIDPELGHKLAEASLFAYQDPYRAATNNKGVLNGMDAVLLATGNDWRAVEAGVHAYAARSGQYRSITRWNMQGADLIGTIEAPIMVGVVGGVTLLHPTAQLCLKILNINSANELARIVAAVGLVQNLGAIRALTTVGIIEGHMKLHITNLSLGAGANEIEFPILQKRLEEFLLINKRISLQHAKEILQDMRQGAVN